MAFDSSASMLFSIDADTFSAQSNIQAFRTILSKDLTDIQGEFSDWSNKVFGDLSTVQGALTGITAAGLGLSVALGGALAELANKTADYALEIHHGAEMTGIAVENMSRLRYAAEVTHTSYEALVGGLSKFGIAIEAAQDPTSKQAAAFHRMGISQAQIAAGSKDMLPLFYRVSDAFKDQLTQTQRLSMERELFGRGGMAMNKVLSEGSAALKQLGLDSDALGKTMSGPAVEAALRFKAELQDAKEQAEGFTLTIGKASLTFPGFLTNTLELAAGFKAVIASMGKDIGHIFSGKDIKGSFKDLFLGLTDDFVKGLQKATADTEKRIAGAVQALKMDNKGPDEPGGDDGAGKVAKLKENYQGLSSVLETVRTRMAATEGEEAKAGMEIARLQEQVAKALDELRKKQSEGALAPGVFEREIAAARQTLAQLPQVYSALMKEIADKREAAGAQATSDLRSRLLRDQEQTREVKEAELNEEIGRLVAQYQSEQKYTAENAALIAQLRKAGLDKIARDEDEAAQKEKERQQKQAADEKAAFDSQMARLQEQAQRIEAEHQTEEQRIAAQYQADVAKFTAAEERKTLAAEKNEARRASLSAQFAIVRKGLYDKEQADLQTLKNSEGWRGVFGAGFADMIRGNENLSRQWAQSQDNAQLIVKGTLTGMGDALKKTFGEFEQAMGSSIANAIVYKKNVREALEETLKSTLASLASEGIVRAIQMTAMGYMYSAMDMPVQASMSFTSAELWGSLGAAAAIAGRFVPGGGSGGAGGSGSGAGGSGGGLSPTNQSRNADLQAGAVGPPTAASGSHVTVNVWGHVIGTSGVGELCSMLNDAVLNKDQTLTSTNTKTGVQVVR